MILKAGHCTACGTLIWRTVTHATTGAVTLLWPDPTSVYVTIERLIEVPGLGGPPTSLTIPGIAYCAACAPTLGPGIVAVEPAGVRYAVWYTSRYARSIRARCRQAQQEPDALLAQWTTDRALAGARQQEGKAMPHGDPVPADHV